MKDKKRIIIFIVIWFIAILITLHSVYTYRYWGRNLPFNMNRARDRAESYMESRFNTDFTVTDSCASLHNGVEGYTVDLEDAGGMPATVVFDTELRVFEAEYPPGNDITR